MVNVLEGLGIVILFFAVGIVLGYYIMKYYYGKRFHLATERCMNEDSFEPLIDEMSEIS